MHIRPFRHGAAFRPIASRRSRLPWRMAMTICSVLWAEDEPKSGSAPQPDFFVDLNLDQIVRSVVNGKGEYDLEPFFRQPLRTVDRHQL